MTEGKMFSQRDLPWMKLGTQIDEPVTAAQAMTLAGLDWDVELRPEGFMLADGSWQVDAEKKKVVRADTEYPLGTVSDTYEILQYREAFDFIDEIDPNIVAAGPLKNDRQAFMVVKAPEGLQGPDGDPHDLFLIMRTSHDGTLAICLDIMALRNCCMNAIGLRGWGRKGGYSGKAKQSWSIRHKKNFRDKLAQAQATILGIEEYAQEFETVSKQLAAIELELDEAKKLFAAVVKEEHPALKNNERVLDGLMQTYEHSPFNGFVGTGWGAVNAVSEFYEHRRSAEREGRSAETRFGQVTDGVVNRVINSTSRRLLTNR